MEKPEERNDAEEREAAVGSVRRGNAVGRMTGFDRRVGLDALGATRRTPARAATSAPCAAPSFSPTMSDARFAPQPNPGFPPGRGGERGDGAKPLKRHFEWLHANWSLRQKVDAGYSPAHMEVMG